MKDFNASNLRSIPLFQALKEEEAEFITKKVFSSEHEPEQMLTMEHDWGESMFVLIDGLAKVRTFNEDGEEIVFCILGKGDVFGELSVVDGGTRSADVVAITTVQLVKLPGQPVAHILKTNAPFTLDIARLEATRLRELNRRFSLQSRDATTRFLNAMAYVACKISGRNDPTAIIPDFVHRRLFRHVGKKNLRLYNTCLVRPGHFQTFVKMGECVPCLFLDFITGSRRNGVDNAGMLYTPVSSSGGAAKSIDDHILLRSDWWLVSKIVRFG